MIGTREITLALHAATPLPTNEHGLPPRHLSHAELLEQHAADPRAADRLTRFANRHRLHIVHMDLGQKVARLSGSPERIAAAFPAARGEAPRVPASLQQDVMALFGAHPSPRARRRTLPRKPETLRHRSPLHLAEAYEFPSPTFAENQVIGLIEFGGGFHPEDIASFCRMNGLNVPRITVVPVRGARNSPAPMPDVLQFLDAASGRLKLSPEELNSDRIGNAEATVEVTMDIEILAALAPGAHIVVYFAPSDHEGQFYGLHHAIHDDQNAPSVLSISWSSPEPDFAPDTLTSLNHLLETAAHLGITVCASSGDHGAIDESPDKLPVVNFPASSPFALGCGGTTTYFARRGDRIRILRELVWNSKHYKILGATGGGVSRTFPTPPWQKHANVPLSPTNTPGRGVPDVAGVADPRFGCDLLIAGRTFTSAGTSAVAPLWAALIARCNGALGMRVGHVTPHLYSLAAQKQKILRPVIKGSNGHYKAGPGWNACTGYGTPIGTELLRALQQHLRTTPSTPHA